MEVIYKDKKRRSIGQQPGTKNVFGLVYEPRINHVSAKDQLLVKN